MFDIKNVWVLPIFRAKMMKGFEDVSTCIHVVSGYRRYTPSRYQIQDVGGGEITREQ